MPPLDAGQGRAALCSSLGAGSPPGSPPTSALAGQMPPHALAAWAMAWGTRRRPLGAAKPTPPSPAPGNPGCPRPGRGAGGAGVDGPGVGGVAGGGGGAGVAAGG